MATCPRRQTRRAQLRKALAQSRPQACLRERRRCRLRPLSRPPKKAGRIPSSPRLPLLASAGIAPLEDVSKSRKLVIDTTHADVQLVIIRGTDVPTYVRHGAADMGVVGKDILLEHGAEGLYEPLDLGISRCRLMTAGPVGWQGSGARIRVATKFVNIARRHFARQGVHAEVIKLYGAMELAPMMNLWNS